MGGAVPIDGVKSRVGLVAWDGDRGSPDSVTLTSGSTPTVVDLADAAHPVNDVFNSTISTAGVSTTGRLPDVANTLGFDASTFDVPVYGAGPLTLKISSPTDAIILGVITLAVPT